MYWIVCGFVFVWLLITSIGSGSFRGISKKEGITNLTLLSVVALFWWLAMLISIWSTIGIIRNNLKQENDNEYR